MDLDALEQELLAYLEAFPHHVFTPAPLATSKIATVLDLIALARKNDPTD